MRGTHNLLTKKIPEYFLILVSCLLLADAHAALDPPHDAGSGIGCLSCHQMTSTYPKLLPPLNHTPLPGDIDDTTSNGLCWSCHYDIMPPECLGCHATLPGSTSAPYVLTHSSLTTDNGYGDWTVECGVCHNPHLQEQNRYNGSTYGKYIRRAINLANIKGEDGNTFIDKNGIPKTGIKAVIFKGQTGPNSFADGEDSTDGVCEVCHTQTSHWTNDGLNANKGVHTGLGGTNCMSCHPHTEGFKADCGACHDFPPGNLVANPGTTGSTTAGAHLKHTSYQGLGCDACHYKNIPDGTHNDGGDLSITIGFNPDPPIPAGGSYDGQGALVSYDRAVASPATTITNNGSKTCSSLYCHGNYAGSGKNAAPIWDDPTTADCGTCHGASNIADSAPESGNHEKHADMDQTLTDQNLNKVTQFNLNRGYKCTLCHKNLVEGSGPTYTLPADKSKHVNGLVEWAFDTTDSRVTIASYGSPAGTNPPSDGLAPNRSYSTCRNVYCHSIVQTNTGGPLTPDSGDYNTPTWGSPVSTSSCGTCHKPDNSHHTTNPMDSGSHTAHVSYQFTTGMRAKRCSLCHDYSNNTSPITEFECGSCHLNGEKTDHVDGEVDVRFATSFTGADATYNGTPTPGDGFATCSATYCHGNYSGSGLNASPAWGNAPTGACGTCHGASNTNTPSSGSHYVHSDDNQAYACTLCHQGIISGTGPTYAVADRTKHVNKVVDWKFDATDPRLQGGFEAYDIASGTQPPSDGVGPNRAYGKCNNLYCHSIVQTATGGALTPNTTDYKTPTWGAGALGCASCHDSIPPSGSHEKHLALGKHCNTCHYSALTTDPICLPCHNSHGPGGIFEVKTDLHANNQVNVDMLVNGSPEGTYNGTLTPADGFSSCSNTYCHSNGTSVATETVPNHASAIWGSGPLPCTSCHSYGPDYPNGSPKANSHQVAGHLAYSCNYCHYTTTNDGTTIASTTDHANKIYDVNAGGGVTFTYTYAPTGGTCANVSAGCHASNPTRIWGQ